MAFTAKLYFLAKKMFKHRKIFNLFNCWLYHSILLQIHANKTL